MAKMKIYDLAWSWDEDYSVTQFTHPDNPSKEQWHEDVKKMLKKYGEEYLKQETGWAGASDWITFVGTKMPELGYSPHAKDTFAWSFFGAFILGDDGGREDEDDIKWKEIVGPDVYKKAIAHNEKIRKAMSDRMVKRKKEIKDGNKKSSTN